jgi:hypothetical protein
MQLSSPYSCYLPYPSHLPSVDKDSLCIGLELNKETPEHKPIILLLDLTQNLLYKPQKKRKL